MPEESKGKIDRPHRETVVNTPRKPHFTAHRIRDVRDRYAPIRDQVNSHINEQREKPRYIGKKMDVSLARHVAASAIDAASEDGLTGFLRKERFEPDLKLYIESAIKKIARGENARVIIAKSDFDRLKSMNSAFGHENADRLIEGMKHMKDASRINEPFYYKIGGDEAVQILDTNTTEKAFAPLITRQMNAVEEATTPLVSTFKQIAQKSRELEEISKENISEQSPKEEPIDLSQVPDAVHLSFGFAEYRISDKYFEGSIEYKIGKNPDGSQKVYYGEPVEVFINRADAALQHAKLTGKNKGVFFKQEEREGQMVTIPVEIPKLSPDQLNSEEEQIAA